MSDPFDPQIPVRRHAVPVRDPRYSPRGRGPRIQASHVLVVVLFCIFLVGAASFVVMALSASEATHSPGPSGSQVALASGSAAPGSLDPGQTAGSTDGGQSASPGPGETPATPGPGETPGPTETPGPVGDLAMPMVPVVSFWSTAESISMHDLTDALKGQSNAYPHVIVEPGDRDAIATALNIKLSDSVENGGVEEIRQKTRNGYLGLLPASDLNPQVRALSIGGASLVGEGHIKKLSDWPLIATVQAPLNRKWDAGSTWTIAAGGDMFLDRGVRNNTIEGLGKGVNFPFQGGTAVVTGHYCCSPSAVKGIVPSYRRTGHAGVVRAMVKNADLAIANLENPIPDNPSWHLNGTVFGGPPKLLGMFNYAGIDWVSLANNHMMDYGSDGVAQTRANLQKVGIPFTGAGKNAAQAGTISYLKANGMKVAMIACVGVVPGTWASANRAGGLPCKDKYVVPLIRQARGNADMVIVFAHWGNEYHRDPFPSQPVLAKSWIDAGADLVMGSHPHLYGGLQEIDGHTVIYSMGNFIFDQWWSTATMEGALTELTFQGTRLVQLKLHPYIILDQAQPNFLNPATDDGKALLGEIRAVADGLGW